MFDFFFILYFYMAGRDPQLDRAIAEILQLMEANPPKLPDFEPRPKLPLP